MKPKDILQRFKTLNVGIAIPSMGKWDTEFAISLQNMLSAFGQFRVGDYKHQKAQVISVKGSILPRQRFHAVKDAMKLECTHLLWIDSDHEFPRKMLHALLEHRLDVVAVNHVTKQIPANTTARYKPVGGDVQGEPVYTMASSPPLEKVWRVGCGTMLVDMKVYQKTGPAIFDVYYNPTIDDYQGEDWTMCEAFENAGFEIWVDHVISIQCKHIGPYKFGHELVGSPKQVEMKEDAKRVVLA